MVKTLPLFVDILSLIYKFTPLSSLLRIDTEVIACERSSDFDYHSPRRRRSQRYICGYALTSAGSHINDESAQLLKSLGLLVLLLYASQLTCVRASRTTAGSRTSALSLESRRKQRVQRGFRPPPTLFLVSMFSLSPAPTRRPRWQRVWQCLMCRVTNNPSWLSDQLASPHQLTQHLLLTHPHYLTR